MVRFSGITRVSAALGLIAVISAGTCQADVIFYDGLSDFQANSSTSLAVTFSGFSPTNTEISSPISLGGVTFTAIDSLPFSPNLIVATPGGGIIFPSPIQSNVLTSTGNEHFVLSFAAPVTAIGFDTYTNSFSPPAISVYDTAGVLLASEKLAQGPDSMGFLGIVSTVTIGRVEWLATGGATQNTAIADVRVGGAAVPEPSSAALWLIAAALVCGFRFCMRASNRRSQSSSLLASMAL